MKRDFLTITDLTAKDIMDIIKSAMLLKQMWRTGQRPSPLENKHAALLFRKPSLRTRASFEVGIHQLGGKTLFFSEKEIGMGKRESVYDVAKVLSRYFDLIVIRTFDNNEVIQLAKHAEIPVINALTDLLHPCQIMGDAMTIFEHKGKIEDVSVAFLGDGGNNVTNSWLKLATRIPLDLRIGTTDDRQPNQKILKDAINAGLSKITVTFDPIEAVSDVDCAYADVWASMGEKDKIGEREIMLRPFQLNNKLLSHAKNDVIVLHCLPAERGREITDEVMDGSHSVVFDEAENRLHIQKAIILHLFNMCV